jgi:Autographiviridae RNA polymerase
VNALKSFAELGEHVGRERIEPERPDTAYDRSIRRARRNVEGLAKSWGTYQFSEPYRAFVKKYCEPLEERIYQSRLDCHGNDNRDVWAALGPLNCDDIAFKLLMVVGAAGCKVQYFGGEQGWYHPLGSVLGFEGRLAIRVGAWAWELLIHHLPVRASLNGGHPEVDPTHDGVGELFENVIRLTAAHRPDLMPLPEPPIPWGQVDSGVLPSDHPIKIKLVDAHPSVEAAWREDTASGQMDEVYAAINYLQATPFEINGPILRLLQRQKAPEIPTEKPKPWQTRKLEEYYEQKQKAWEWRYMLEEAKALLLYCGTFYVPLKFDTRGRINGVCHFAYQRGDYVRSLFLLANGEPIGEEGLLWLAAHAAARADGNTWDGGDGKPSRLDLDGRVAWATKHMPRLLRIGNDILEDRDLQPNDLPGADDEPYQFAAACVEMALANGDPTYVSQLPVIFDGSCNGLQHLAYMLRAPEGLRVNLLSGANKEDVYRDVTEIVESKYPELLKWIPNPRKIFKPTGMTYSYGSRAGGWGKNKQGRSVPFGMTGQVVEELEERKLPTSWRKHAGGEWEPFGEDDYLIQSYMKQVRDEKVAAFLIHVAGLGLKPRARKRLINEYATQLHKEQEEIFPTLGAHDLAKAAYDAIEELMPCGKKMRDFLEEIAQLYADHGLQMRWPTPTGLTVWNTYYVEKKKDVSIRHPKKGRSHFKFPDGYTNIINDDKAVQSVTANFTHSADANHLHRVAQAAQAERIGMVPVHDCYACLPSQARRYNLLIREQFKRLHTEWDWPRAVLVQALHDLPVGTKLPERPPDGDLDEEGILSSFFAFS